jgi:DNA-binding CsgD family transcriptional regulator
MAINSHKIKYPNQMKQHSINCKSNALFVHEEELSRYAKIDEHLVETTAHVRLARNEIGLYDLFKNEYLWYRSTQHKVLEPLYALGFTQQRSPDFFFKQLKKADANFIRETIDQTVAFLQKKEAGDRKNYVLHLDASVQHPNGNYYRFVHQSYVLESKADDAGWLVLCILSLIDIGPRYTPPLRMLRHTDSVKSCLFCHKNNDHTICFTHKQRKLVRYIAMGYSAKEIALHFGIIKDTVDKERASIMAKTKTKNVAQLVNYAKIIGLV